MASINSVTIDLKVRGEATATKSLKDFAEANEKVGTNVVGLANKVSAGVKEFSKLDAMHKQGIITENARRKAQAELARQMSVLTGLTETQTRAALRAAETARKNAEETRRQNAERQRAKQSYDNLLASINPTIAAQQRLRQAHEQVRAALAAGIITRQQAAQTLRDYRAAAQASAAASQQQSLRLNQMGVVAQQAGYQIGDFFVQIQSGTNAMVAFGQQATQLVGTFAMFAKTTRAAVIASGIGIFISIATAVGAAIMRMNGQMDTLDTKVQKMTSSFDELNSSMDRLEDTELDQTFGNLTDEIESITEAMVDLNNAAALNNLESTFEKLEEYATAGFARQTGEAFRNIARFYDPFTTGGGYGFGMITPEEVNLEKFQKLGYDMSREQYLAYLDGLQQLASQGDIEGVTSLIAQFFQDATDGAAEVSILGIDVAKSMETAALQAAEFAARQNGSAEAARLLREQIEAQAEAERVLAEENAKYAAAQNEANQKLKELTAKISASHQAYIPLGLAAQEAKDATEKHVSEMAELFKNAQDLRTELGAAAYEAGRLAGMDMTSGINAAAKAALSLAIRLGTSVDAALALINIEKGMKQQSGPRRESGRALPQVTANIPGSLGETYRRSMGIGEFAKGGGGGGGGTSGARRDPAEEFKRAKAAVDQLRASYDEQYATSLKVAEAQEKINKAVELGVYTNEQGKEALENYIASLNDAESPMQKIAQTARDALGDAFMSIVDGTKSAKDAFADMARIILKQAFELLVIKPILDGIFGGLTGGRGGGIFSLFSANGNAFSGGNVIPFANGGVVGGPTAFPMSGGRMGLMGEAGPEAIMPLKRGKGGKLGVVAEGSSQPVVINQSFNFQANGDDSVKRIIAQEAPKIANLTQKQVLEARSRGGAFRTTFGA